VFRRTIKIPNPGGKDSKMKMKHLRVKYIINFITFTILFFLCKQSADNDRDESIKIDKQEMKAHVTFTLGASKVKKAHRKVYTSLKKNSFLTAGDVVRTGKNSQVTLSIENSTICKIMGSSKVKIASLFINQNNQGRKNIFHLKSGKILLNPRKLAPGDNYQISTVTSVAAVRGTKFVVSYSPKYEKSSISVGEGRVSVFYNFPEFAKLSEKIISKSAFLEKLKTLIQSSTYLYEGQNAQIDSKLSNKINRYIYRIVKKYRALSSNLPENDLQIRKIIDKEFPVTKLNTEILNMPANAEILSLPINFYEIPPEDQLILLEPLAVSKPKGPGQYPDKTEPKLSGKKEYSKDFKDADKLENKKLVDDTPEKKKVFLGKKIWTVKIKSTAQSKPAVEGRRIYVINSSSVLIALNRYSGKVLWKRVLDPGRYSSPFIDQGMLFAGSSNGLLYAVHIKNGAIKWKKKVGAVLFGAMPVSQKSRLFIGTASGELRAVNKFTGEKLWSYQAKSGIYSSAYTRHNKLFFNSEDGTVHCLNLLTGKKLWSFKTGGRIISSNPVLYQNMVILGSYNGSVYAIGAYSGKLIWRFKTGKKITSSPRVQNGIVFFGSTDQNIYALDVKSGQMIWKKNLGAPVNEDVVLSGKNILAGAGNHLYLFSSQGNLIWSKLMLSPVKSVNSITEKSFIVSTESGRITALTSY
jgi:outer membrane protein assembly factor BamB